MALITLRTLINMPLDRVFDLARDVDVHTRSTSATGERVVAGVLHGRMSLGDEVTWEARHFGLRLRLSSRITEFEPHRRFVDEMVRGPFARLRHVHEFQPSDGGTQMVDVFDYAPPLGAIGRLADALFLRRYMTRFLVRRNAYVKQIAEGRSGDEHSG